jgi:hypothetical protein
METSNVEATEYLTHLINKTLRIHTSDSRIFVGTMKCTDRVCPLFPLSFFSPPFLSYLETFSDEEIGTQHNPLPNPRIPSTVPSSNFRRGIYTPTPRIYGKSESGHGEEICGVGCCAGETYKQDWSWGVNRAAEGEEEIGISYVSAELEGQMWDSRKEVGMLRKPVAIHGCEETM